MSREYKQSGLEKLHWALQAEEAHPLFTEARNPYLNVVRDVSQLRMCGVNFGGGGALDRCENRTFFAE